MAIQELRPVTSLPQLSQQLPKNSGRQEFVDGLRALAALYVVLHHSYLHIWPLWHRPTGWVRIWTGWLFWGHFAVTVFIVISGYCLALPVIRQGRAKFSVPVFLKRRAWRILPPYYLGLATTGILIAFFIGHKTGTHWDIVLPATRAALIRGLLLVPEFGGTINHTYWSVGVECKIYLLFPLLVALIYRLGLLATVSLATVASFGVSVVFHNFESVHNAVPHYVGLFCCGMAAAYIVNSDDRRWVAARESRIWWLVFVAAAGTIVALCSLWGLEIRRYVVLDFFVGCCSVSALVLAGRSEDGALRKALSWKPLVAVGGFSYSLYLIHAPLLQVAWQYLISPLSLPDTMQFAVLLLLVPLIVLCAWVFYRLCERPFIPRS